MADTPSLSLEDVDRIAHLARLALTDEEREVYHRQMSSILEYVNTLQALDTAGIEATFMVLPRYNVLRDDVVAASLDPSLALQNAPDAAGPFFRIPRILEEE